VLLRSRSHTHSLTHTLNRYHRPGGVEGGSRPEQRARCDGPAAAEVVAWCWWCVCEEAKKETPLPEVALALSPTRVRNRKTARSS